MADPEPTSKKQSAASSKSKPPERIEFFLDRSLGRNRVAEALRSAEQIVHIHDDHFPQDEADTIWLKEVSRRGWVILSKDKMIRRRLVERDALLQASARAFFLGSGNMTGDEMAEAFVAALPAMRRVVRKTPAPFIASVTKAGTVTVLNLEEA